MHVDAMTLEIQGPFDSSFSLAIVNRRLAFALADLPGIAVRLRNIDDEGPSRPSLGLRRDTDVEPLSVGCEHLRPTHVIRNHYPPRFDDLDPQQRNYFYFA